MPKIGDRLGGQVWRKCEICGEEHWCPESHLDVELWKCTRCGREIEHIVGRPSPLLNGMDLYWFPRSSRRGWTSQ